MKKMKIYFLAIFVLITCISCMYQRPVLSIRVSKKVIADSITHGTRIQNNYNYWGVRKLTRLGGYSKTKVFDSLGNKVVVRHWKKKPLHVHDGNVRSYSKIIYYNNLGEKEKITKRVFQKLGTGGQNVLDTTIYFENGKRVKSLKE